MRVSFIVLAAAAVMMAVPAHAVENFVPLGHSYSPDQPELPAFDSEQDRLNSRVDIYESEIYSRLRRAKMFSSQLDHFSNDQELRGSGDFIDY